MAVLSVYLSNHHDYPTTWDYLKRLQPSWVRVHQADARTIYLVQQNCPGAKLMLRSWDIDDHNNDRKQELYSNPKQAAKDTIARWAVKLGEIEEELHRNGWGYNPERWYLGLWNEPDPAYLAQVVEATAEAMRISPYRLGVLCASVGNFGKPGENNSWTLCKSLEQSIKAGGHVLIAHEYWQPEGPSAVWVDEKGSQRHDAGNLAWRHQHIPLDVPILIGESGANGYIYGRHTQQDNGGWQKYMKPEQYAAQVREYIEGCDSRVEGVCLYMTDYHSDQWKSFDTTPAHEQLLAVKDVKPMKVYVPIVGGGPTQPKPQPTGNIWERSIAWVLQREGGFQNNPNDQGNYYNGQLIGTKYGISAASWGGQYDIPNLTIEQAKDIYYQHYWLASGANKLDWPLCLLLMDTAVLHGTGTAKAWLKEVGLNPFLFAAKRMNVYTKMDNWHYWGAGWVNRLADLFKELGAS